MPRYANSVTIPATVPPHCQQSTPRVAVPASQPNICAQQPILGDTGRVIALQQRRNRRLTYRRVQQQASWAPPLRNASSSMAAISLQSSSEVSKSTASQFPKVPACARRRLEESFGFRGNHFLLNTRGYREPQ